MSFHPKLINHLAPTFIIHYLFVHVYTLLAIVVYRQKHFVFTCALILKGCFYINKQFKIYDVHVYKVKTIFPTIELLLPLLVYIIVCVMFILILILKVASGMAKHKTVIFKRSNEPHVVLFILKCMGVK